MNLSIVSTVVVVTLIVTVMMVTSSYAIRLPVTIQLTRTKYNCGGVQPIIVNFEDYNGIYYLQRTMTSNGQDSPYKCVSLSSIYLPTALNSLFQYQLVQDDDDRIYSQEFLFRFYFQRQTGSFLVTSGNEDQVATFVAKLDNEYVVITCPVVNEVIQPVSRIMVWSKHQFVSRYHTNKLMDMAEEKGLNITDVVEVNHGHDCTYLPL